MLFQKKEPLELTKVDPILSMFLDADGNQRFTEEQKKQWSEEARAKKPPMQVGAYLVNELKLISNEDLQHKLGKQAELRMNSAVKDIDALADKKVARDTKLPDGWELKPNWKVYGKKENPTVTDASIALANMAQNMVLVANANPGKMAEKLKESVHEANTLADALSDPAVAATMKPETLEKRLETINKGIVAAGLESGLKKEDIAAYIEANNAEIMAAYQTAQKKVSRAEDVGNPADEHNFAADNKKQLASLPPPPQGKGGRSFAGSKV